VRLDDARVFNHKGGQDMIAARSLNASIQTSIEEIGPERARQYLEMNTTNRPVRHHTVKLFASTMMRGSWQLTHQGIAFDSDGNLIDGQHRLSAIILCGLSIKMNVTRGVPNDAYHFIDIGLKRRYCDILNVKQSEAEVYQGVTRILMKHSRISSDMVNDVARNLMDITSELLSFAPTSTRVFSSAPVKTAAVLRMLHFDNKEYVMKLYRNLTLVNLEDLPPIGIALNRQVLQNKTSARDTNDLMARSWIAFDFGRRNLRKIQVTEPLDQLTEMRYAYLDHFNAHEWMGTSS
jgi:hypothetical protein